MDVHHLLMHVVKSAHFFHVSDEPEAMAALSEDLESVELDANDWDF